MPTTPIPHTLEERRPAPLSSPRRSGAGVSGRRLGGALALAAVALVLVAAAPAGAQDGVYTRTYELQPGWNAIQVDLAPSPADLDAVMSGLPVDSVWGYFPPIGQVDFIDDPAQGLERVEGWRGWYPRPRPEALLSNLFGLEAGRSYLIKLNGSAPAQLRISGRPLNLPISWVPDSFNLVGFPVDPAQPPTFGAYLAASPAHSGQPIYRLSSAGVWQQLPSPYSAQIRAGEAYWVYTHGNSSYQGPLEVETEAYDGMEYGGILDEQRLVVKNRGQVDAQMRVRRLAAATPIPFQVATQTATGVATYAALPADSSFATVAGQELYLEIGVQRSALTADRSEQLLEITDGLGSRRLVYAGVSKTQLQNGSPLAATSPYAGLWIGQVAVSGVSQSQSAGTTAQPVGDVFRFRILIHVDASGQARLLKEVTQMWQDGTTRPDPANPSLRVVDTPGRYVLITNPALIPSYGGAAQRDGVPVGLRLSTVAYDFPQTELAMTGSVGPAGSLSIALAIPATSPTNPYLHRYHPDHDNLDAQFLNPQIEAFDITRSLELTFSPVHPAGRPGPGWGSSELGGTYRERIDGMHKNPVFTEGIFLLSRVAATAQLNG